MAIFHSHIQVFSRGKGKSAVAAAAYRSGEALHNEYDNQSFDYTRKGGIVHTEILLPQFAPQEFLDRNTLWNAVEKIEKAKNAQLAREIEVALPVELSLEKNIELLRKYVTENFVKAGMVADVCVHVKSEDNPHAHIMLTMRPFEQDGSWGAKAHKVNGKKICTTDWNEQYKATEWRENWAEIVNQTLATNGFNSRIDHRSYEEQGVEQIPTVHLGVSVTQMERRGIITDRGNENRAIKSFNQQIKQLNARIKKIQVWLSENTGESEPDMLSILDKVFEKKFGQHTSVANLKMKVKTSNFMMSNDLKTLSDLNGAVGKLHDKAFALRDEMKPIERRLKTLEGHQEQRKKLLDNQAVYRKYKSITKPKKAEEFYEHNRAAITLYESAQRYFVPILKGKKIPVNKWASEYAELTIKEHELLAKYKDVKEDVKSAETIRKFANDVMREQKQARQRSQGYAI